MEVKFFAASDRYVIIGLDLSLRATAACAAPLSWDHDLTKVHTRMWGSTLKADATPEQRVQRIAEIVDGVLEFCFQWSATRVFAEEMAFAQSGSHAREVAELTGVVKHRLYRDRGLVVVPIVASRARKILLQKLPRKDIKGWVVANVKRLPGTKDWTPDECDAFVVMNGGIELAGGIAMSFAGED